MVVKRFNPQSTALLLIDLQNDALHPKGAYGRAGVASENLQALPKRLIPLCQSLRRQGGWVIATHFTILEGKNAKPIITENTRQLRPFLVQGDFLRGSWGHALVDDLTEVDVHIDKYVPSAFDMSPLEWLLHQLKVETILLAGITTPVSVVCTARGALQRDFQVVVLEDGVASLDQKQHQSALSEMSGVAAVGRCADVLGLISQGP